MTYLKKLFPFFFTMLLFSCVNPKTDEELLAIDKEELVESLDSDKVFMYKFIKVAIRSSQTSEKEFPGSADMYKKVNRIGKKIDKAKTENKNLSVLEYISIYKDYRDIKDFIIKTDEDVFPTLIETFFNAHKKSPNKQQVSLAGVDKIKAQNIEHAILSVIVILSKDLGKEISLYEASKTYPDQLPDGELKALLLYCRGFLFFEKGLLYLSEDQVSRNITWLNNNEQAKLPLTRAFFQWGNLNNQQTHTGFHAMNHLFRGLNRLKMEREIDEKRAIEDLTVFLDDSKKLGLANEITTAIETYVHLKNEDSEKAIASLKELRTSKLLGDMDRESIDKSIAYLEDREPGKALNGPFDKIFLGKIASKYMIAILSKIDWEKVMKDNNVPYTKELFDSIEAYNEFVKNLSKLSTAEGLKDAGKKLQNQGEDLWDKTKGLLDEEKE